MSESDDLPKPERIPFFQRMLENPFLLLFIGVTMPTVFYILWGIMEIQSFKRQTWISWPGNPCASPLPMLLVRSVRQPEPAL